VRKVVIFPHVGSIVREIATCRKIFLSDEERVNFEPIS
jgi:hypothetical protein